MLLVVAQNESKTSSQPNKKQMSVKTTERKSNKEEEDVGFLVNIGITFLLFLLLLLLMKTNKKTKKKSKNMR